MSATPSLACEQVAGESVRAALAVAVEVTIVIPCLNEARTVVRCIEAAHHALGELGINGEVVVADNGSTDGSPELAGSHGARVVFAERKGYGAALQAGIEAAKGEYVIMGDADDSYDFSALRPFIERLRQGDDLVMGNRFLGGILPGAMPPLHRYVGNPMLTGVLNLFFHSPVRDAHCGLRAFRKNAYEKMQLSSTGMEFASEMVVKACLNHLRISEVPVILRPDGRDRPPHLRSFHDGWRHLRLMLLLCPTWLFMVPASLLMALGLTLMIWLSAGSRRVGFVVLDVHTMLLGSLCVLLAHQMMWMWAHAKAHGWTSGTVPPDRFSRWIAHRFCLERGLLIGAALLLAGLLFDLGVVAAWYRSGLGPLEVRTTLRFALWGLTALVAGAQTISSSFLLSMQFIGPNSAGVSRPITINKE